MAANETTKQPLDKYVLSQVIDASLWTGFKTAVGSGIALSLASLMAYERFPYYRGFNLPSRLFFIGSGISLAAIVAAEQSLSRSYQMYRLDPGSNPSDRSTKPMVPAMRALNAIRANPFYALGSIATTMAVVGWGGSHYLQKYHHLPAPEAGRHMIQASVLLTVLGMIGYSANSRRLKGLQEAASSPTSTVADVVRHPKESAAKVVDQVEKKL